MNELKPPPCCYRCGEPLSLDEKEEFGGRLCRLCSKTVERLAEEQRAADLRDAAIEHVLDEHKRMRDERGAPDVEDRER